MKKFFFFAIIAAAFSFAACSSEETTDEQTTEDSTAVVAEPAPVDTIVAEEPAVEEPAAKPAAKQQAKEETQAVEKTKPKMGGTQGKVAPGTTTQKESIDDAKAHLDQKAAAKKEITSGKKAAATTGTAKQGLTKPE